MQAEDIRKIRTPSGLTIAPDGSAVAFVVTEIDGNSYRSTIHRVATDGASPPVQLTEGPADTAPAWSPDGKTIAFLRADRPPTNQRAPHQLWIMPVAGGTPRRLTDHPLGVGSPVTARHARGVAAPVWSPDGTRIAYTARVPENGMPVEGQPRRIVRLRYRIDELGYVHDRPSHVFIVGVGGGQPTRLSEAGFDHWDVSWHPQGTHVLAVTARHADRDLDELNDIVALGLDGSMRCLTMASTTVNLPTCAPDGLFVYFVGIGDLGSDPNDARARNLGLWKVSFAGGAPQRLTDAETVDLDDGRTRPLIVTADDVLGGRLERGAVHLVSIGADGTPRTLIGGQRQVTDYARAGATIVASVASTASAGEIIALRDGQERALTDLGAVLTASRLRPMQEIGATAPDGYPVHGWLMLPEGSGPHPLLLLVHGGPDVQGGYTFFDEAQVYAAAGYAVILSNPRGSAGYGEAHARAIKGRVGTVDAEDLIALLGAVTARPEIDGARVGVLGGSYGGFMTTWLAAHHGQRFRAALAERGVYAQDSMIGTSDISIAITSMIGADRGTWAHQSPLTYAGKIDIPILLMHWEGDLRVPFEQAQRMFAALRAQKKMVEFVVFPGGTHNASRSGPPAQRIERFRIILEWFGRHLV